MKILITGGASGLGKSITERLASKKDHEVFFTYCHSKEEAGRIEDQFQNTHSTHVDFANNEDILRLVNFMQDKDIDVLVNNAISLGINKKHFHKIKQEDFLEGIKRNVLPVLSITQAAIEIFRKKKSGKIITILTSSLVNKPPVGYSEYTACKAYLLSMSKSWANENASFNITSNCISPAFMKTGLTSDTDERIIDQMTTEHPLKTLLSAEETAKAVDFFVEASQQFNGINFIINAGTDVI
jgi:NAD(P)-dependent dehydrogenase (short-subunit alcohol dehydrogenase family)